MMDYISREDVLRYIAEDCRKTRAHLGLYRDNKAVQIDICRIPAADVVPVVHAEWVVSRTDRGWNCAEYPTHCKCTHCGRELPYLDRDNYCPNCGAKMDKEENE